MPKLDAISRQAIRTVFPLLKESEGLRLDAYPDPLHGWAIPTIGYGTTKYETGQRVSRGDRVTEWQADLLLMLFILKIVRIQEQRIPTWGQMNANQRAAIISLFYNIGEYSYGSTNRESITRLLNEPEYWDRDGYVHKIFAKYCNPGTNVEAGLRKRRKKEAELFLTYA